MNKSLLIRHRAATLPEIVYRCCSSVTVSVLALLFACVQPQKLCGEGQTLAQMVHTSWEGRDGAPQAIDAIAQTSDGLLWIASPRGLYTFDGLTYKLFQAAPGSTVPSSTWFHYLFVTKDGALWAFPYHGPPSRILHGKLDVYNRAERGDIDVMSFPQEDRAGGIWAICNERSLVKLSADGIWQAVADPAQGHGHITKLFVDSRDNMWLVVQDRLYRRPPTAKQFGPTNIFAYGWVGIEEGPEHDLWITSSGPQTSVSPPLPLQHIDGLGNPVYPVPHIKATLIGLVPAADGSLWGLTVSNMLFHLSKEAIRSRKHTAQNFGYDWLQLHTGLGQLGNHAFFKSSDGSIWVGGVGGLEHFTTATLVPAMTGSRLGPWTSCVDSSGRLWIASPSGDLYRRRNGRFHKEPSWQGVDNLFCSGMDHPAFVDGSGIAVWRDNNFTRLPLLPGFRGYSNHYIFTGLAQTEDGKIIAAAAGGAIGHSLWIFEHGRWAPFLSTCHLPEVSAMLQDSTRGLYLGFRSSEVDLLHRGKLKKLFVEKPGIGAVLNLASTSYGVFASGVGGVALQRGDAIRKLTFVKPEQPTLVTGLVEAKNGDLWINGGLGIVRVSAFEIKQAISDPTHRIVSTNIQEGNFVGPSYPSMFSDSAHIDPSGRLWFATLSGVVSVQPECLPSTSLPPRLSIRSIEADGQPFRADHTFPKDVQTLRIAYIGIDLTHPRSVEYRYQLEGSDNDWQEVGSRTEAIYTHLRPGSYTFRVMAGNAFGAWTTSSTSVSFTILPHFYQRSSFQILCAFVTVVVFGLAVRARVAFVAAGIRSRANERADERISIARDLHDTLLQGVQGLLLSFHSASERVPVDHPSKQALERALATADKLILEGRDRVKGLRSLDLTDADLCPAIEALGRDLCNSGPPRFSLVCSRTNDLLRPYIATEVFLIAREAVMNAFRHAEASQITVNLSYGKRLFSISITDDGRGVSADASADFKNRNHWGIKGMRERADKIKASFACSSTPGMGTSVRVTLKAKRAYE